MSAHNLDYKKFVLAPNLQYFKPHASIIEKSFSEEILSSLNRESKFVNPKFFYDQNGSSLFERICTLPEYYPTRTEISILKNISNELLAHVDKNFRLVELGSGASTKTRILLDLFTSFQEKTEYFPIDISEILTESSEELLKIYDQLHITGIVDSYEGGLRFLNSYDDKKNLILFLGSSFGNFSSEDGHEFLKKINATMKSEDLFLIGLDLVKSKSILESAYNDSQGITADFNLNVLSRINDELDADFNLDNFSHYAVYNEEKQRIEMYLKSLVNQSIVISKSNFILNLKKDELIHTEHSHKYTKSQISHLLEDAGFTVRQMWSDENDYFSLTLVSKN